MGKFGFLNKKNGLPFCNIMKHAGCISRKAAKELKSYIARSELKNGGGN